MCMCLNLLVKTINITVNRLYSQYCGLRLTSHMSTSLQTVIAGRSRPKPSTLIRNHQLLVIIHYFTSAINLLLTETQQILSVIFGQTRRDVKPTSRYNEIPKYFCFYQLLHEQATTNVTNSGPIGQEENNSSHPFTRKPQHEHVCCTSSVTCIPQTMIMESRRITKIFIGCEK